MEKRHLISSDDFVFFNKQLANLLDTHLPIVPGLENLARDITNKNLQKVITEIAGEITAGKTVSEAFSRHSHLFPPTYLAMVRAGEMSGRLPDVMKALAVYSQKMNRIQKKIQEIMVYPVILITVGFLIVVLICARFSSPFREIVGSLPQKHIPGIVSFVLFLSIRWPVILAVLLCIILGVWFLYVFRKQTTGLFFERLKFRIPAYGKILRLAALSRFAQNAGMLLSSHIPLQDALLLAGETSGCLEIGTAAAEMRENLGAGRQWTEVLDRSPVFPRTFSWMVKMGDRKGDVKESFSYLADFYEEAFDRQTYLFIHFLEPAVIVLVGCIIGLVMIIAIRLGFGAMLGMFGDMMH